MRTALAITVFCCLPWPAAYAAEFNGYLALTTDYVQRGVSRSDTDPAIQLGGDVSFESGLVLGAWGSSVDNPSQPGQQHDVELNAYAGYGRDIGDRWRLSAFAVAYRFPGMDTPFDYDYLEYLVSANYDDRFWIEYTVATDYYGTGDRAWNIEALGEWPLHQSWNVSAGVGRLDLGRVVGSGYTYWQVGVNRGIGIAIFDLRFHDTDGVVPFFSRPETAKARVVLTLTIPF